MAAAAFAGSVAASPAAGLNTSSHAGPEAAVRAPVRPDNLLGEAEYEYDTMTASRYQAPLRVNLTRGTYFYDCVGFVTYALGRVAPIARETIYRTFNIAPDRIPSPARYVALFGLLNRTQAGWQPVPQVADLAPGDVVAWTYTHPHGANGHAFVVGSAPQRVGTHKYLVTVWDSTATPHGPGDTRLTNPKNLPGRNGKPSGLGRGQVALDTAANGSIVRVHWSPNGSAVGPATYGMGRPVA